MNIKEMQDEIMRIKKEKDICILAHAYQSHDIWEVADYVGDSFGLAQRAAEAPQKTMIMCGVRFMAETVKLLSPEKTVYLPEPDAGCPMADQIDYDLLAALREKNPDYTVVAYVNTTTEVKTLSDVCVTSSSAVKIVKNMPEKDILFIPDCNLGSWVKKQVPEKNIKLVSGGCPTHVRVTVKDVEKAKAAHPNALLLVHPECLKEVTELADYAGSTTGIMDYAAKSDAKEFIIGTENSIVSHLQLAHPEKRFYALSKDCVCHNMKMTTLGDVYNCVVNGEGESITLTEETMQKARKSIDAMLRLG
ncbi:MAG: quinolinate synthase NadA [Coprococcus sp.]|jgi:quinolinate synthase|uniref:quinolinate synthase NadA n=1 Tax=Clostridia TaxID=186801 RepID=UPI00015BE864|nr:quinolinate synthase NadA [Clostridium sp. L2-50]MDD6465204.1 quinolinate synthase NadA [Coprococcus sp.]UEA74821.1 quinolinate synthase NadA [Lachnospiraceae bacterium GAM79]EDO57145.1 quinolinate synthetase complex, A subunit [Clostridium sp. L2-50]MED9988629.1 quinolinate synthase NadA [Coprococcus sp.]UEA78015.1 quinolinate synthase NadA [Lachnospiraceae bacterium GAM79]